jgi:hypothetical protein
MSSRTGKRKGEIIMPEHYTITISLREEAMVSPFRGEFQRNGKSIIFESIQEDSPTPCQADRLMKRGRFPGIAPQPAAALDDIHQKAKQPIDRFQSAMGLLRDLERIQSFSHAERL